MYPSRKTLEILKILFIYARFLQICMFKYSVNIVQVRVLFLNPTHKEILPCPYYLDGKCKFSDQDCRFSHGELIPLSSIQEYR